ncbi:ABC transporter substrate-binding protein [Tabrizicola sp. J26]|uniref:MlaC/ttg2D family ABC transporter substrate-binding protein n=1 Tax=Alitabrizicola rongguiensis TaxID=2909234 RepID=UPI001F300F8C|nr:ABC transporter substrate-binding protein [Tabrizicola rongguiensis]MCF1707741.1 ABC transporter substrate-binding protein [Tabrizicola rongguiensis]
MATETNRRTVLGLGLGAMATAVLLPRGALALTVDQARALINEVTGQVTAVINSGASEAQMLAKFEQIFAKYADVQAIARSALGPAARQASPAQMKAFTQAYQGYISRKYGRRFREFIGGRIEVTGAQPLKSYYEVISTAYLQGEAPFDLRWHVSDKSGRDKFFNLIIEGVNMLSTERTEIGAMLDKQGGDLDKLIAQLKKT